MYMIEKISKMSGIYLSFLAGVLLICIPLYQNHLRNQPLITNDPNLFKTPVAIQAPIEKKVISGKPVHITIPSLGIDLSVIDGVYQADRKKWTVSDTAAVYATETALANDSYGSTFIYGHNQAGVFDILLNVQPSAEAIITADNGKIFVYTFRASMQTVPEDTDALHYQGKPILTLQTCTGAWLQYRTHFVFDFKEVRT